MGGDRAFLYAGAQAFFPLFWLIDRTIESVHLPFRLVEWIFSFRAFGLIVWVVGFVGIDLKRIGSISERVLVSCGRYFATVFQIAFVLLLRPAPWYAQSLFAFMIGFHPVTCVVPFLFRADPELAPTRIAYALATISALGRFSRFGGRAKRIWGFERVPGFETIWRATIMCVWVINVISLLGFPSPNYDGDLITQAQFTLQRVSYASNAS